VRLSGVHRAPTTARSCIDFARPLRNHPTRGDPIPRLQDVEKVRRMCIRMNGEVKARADDLVTPDPRPAKSNVRARHRSAWPAKELLQVWRSGNTPRNAPAHIATSIWRRKRCKQHVCGRPCSSIRKTHVDGNSRFQTDHTASSPEGARDFLYGRVCTARKFSCAAQAAAHSNSF